jgi:hypothetical protein
MAVIIDGDTGIVASGNISGNNMSTSSSGSYKSGAALAAPTFKDSSGTEIGTLCRAWVNFNGVGTVAIRGSFNVSSITDNGVGNYTVNFTNAMIDNNYVAPQMARGNSATFGPNVGTNLTPSACTLLSYDLASNLIDREILGCAIFR